LIIALTFRLETGFDRLSVEVQCAMRSVVLFALASLTVFAADNPWDKVCQLKTGTELRILKRGTSKPVIGTMDEANDERLIVVIKNEQLAIQKDDIDRIDFRPAGKSKVAKETHTTETDSTQTTPVGPQPKGSQPGPSTSTTTTYGGASKPDFETIYRRTAK
jgi:hypothetical protein